ncbi:MAG: sugar ABC transporter ATP-binding protein [Solirubrobacterales bacterium]|nr:sugar ABC transporter ATP-binding protein [Solirubrobacterales bacterium]
MSVPAEQVHAAGADGPPPVLELRGICKRFGAVRALDAVDFHAASSEVVALVGDNGAGKSTLVKTIAGAHQPDEGTILFEGREVSFHSPHDATALGIETVYQDLALCDNLDVVQNMFLGREVTRRLLPPIVEPLRHLEMEGQALKVLERLNVTTVQSVRLPVARLSGGQRQSVAISRAVMWNSKIVLLDEPTAALGVAQTRQVVELIRRLREQGLGVVVISHNLTEVFEVADRIVVLRLGAVAAEYRREDTNPDQVVAAITGAATGTTS